VHTGGRVAPLDEHLNALWYIVRNGLAWRALPAEFGHWFTVFQYCNRLSDAGFFDYLHNVLVLEDTAETVPGDSTHCKVHQHACGAPSPKNQALGRSRGISTRNRGYLSKKPFIIKLRLLALIGSKVHKSYEAKIFIICCTWIDQRNLQSRSQKYRAENCSRNSQRCDCSRTVV
jgi:transposase